MYKEVSISVERVPWYRIRVGRSWKEDEGDILIPCSGPVALLRQLEKSIVTYKDNCNIKSERFKLPEEYAVKAIEMLSHYGFQEFKVEQLE